MQQVRIRRKPWVTEVTGLSPSTYRRLEMAGQFPKRIKLSKSAVGWIEAEVLAWVESRKAEGVGYAQ
ncbi:MAG: helix-turn-helix transcriptional regulator [Solidesulfovibrio sp. DCME]|uniref:helix-turn-helix transcriptional regulator n=1 Tax=Solidesulfovibrio sp. DCME TaxID=3447380 RepID=UPI003D106462